MLFSSCLLQNCVKNKKKTQINSNFTQNSLFKGITIGVALLIMIIELMILFYSVGIALRCTKPGTERFVHIVLVIMFPFPYALVSAITSQCAKDYLQTF
jgi:hypothetical protein